MRRKRSTSFEKTMIQQFLDLTNLSDIAGIAATMSW